MPEHARKPINSNTKALLVVTALLLVIAAALLLFPDFFASLGMAPDDGQLALYHIPPEDIALFTQIQLQTRVPWQAVYGICYTIYEPPYTQEAGMEIAQTILDAGAEEKGLLVLDQVEDLVGLYTSNRKVAGPAIRYALRLQFADAFLTAGEFPFADGYEPFTWQQGYADGYTITLREGQDVRAIISGQANYLMGQDGKTRLLLKGNAGVDILYELDGDFAVEDGAFVTGGDTLGNCNARLVLWIMQDAQPINPYPYLHYWTVR
ncbi:hypothetical protein LJC55_03630 [Eubacteriales bacterium OttesenSCG-928-N14]|nr:hypothetical protein [Eubacteriales bacterium OttesenSCG-928-N14]